MSSRMPNCSSSFLLWSWSFWTAACARMKATPTEDPLFGKGTIRADGRKIHPAYLVEVKKPAESKGPWDYYKIRSTIPADQAFRPLADGGCPLVK